MSRILPQQRLLLELLVMSGEIAVPQSAEGSLLWKTLRECKGSGWLRLKEISPGLHRVDVTALGRLTVKPTR